MSGNWFAVKLPVVEKVICWTELAGINGPRFLSRQMNKLPVVPVMPLQSTQIGLGGDPVANAFPVPSKSNVWLGSVIGPPLWSTFDVKTTLFPLRSMTGFWFLPPVVLVTCLEVAVVRSPQATAERLRTTAAVAAVLRKLAM